MEYTKITIRRSYASFFKQIVSTYMIWLQDTLIEYVSELKPTDFVNIKRILGENKIIRDLTRINSTLLDRLLEDNYSDIEFITHVNIKEIISLRLRIMIDSKYKEKNEYLSKLNVDVKEFYNIVNTIEDLQNLKSEIDKE